jgi:glutathione S-transferase
MKLYGHPMSTCTRKVLTTLAEKGHEAEFVMVDIMKGEAKHAAHLAHQPFGKVPALEDHNFKLYESRAIIRYLDEKLDGPKLTPTDIHDRAHMDQWMSVEYSYFSSPAMKIVMELLFGKMSGKTPDMEVVKAARASLATVLDISEKALTHHHYFGGKIFSLADISWMPYVQYLFAAEQGDLFTSRPAMNAWWERVSTRPSWKKVAGV